MRPGRGEGAAAQRLGCWVREAGAMSAGMFGDVGQSFDDTGYTCVGNSAARNYCPTCSGDFGHQRQLQILAVPLPHAPGSARHPRTVHARTAGPAHVHCAAGVEPLHTGTRREDLKWVWSTSAARRRLVRAGMTRDGESRRAAPLTCMAARVNRQIPVPRGPGDPRDKTRGVGRASPGPHARCQVWLDASRRAPFLLYAAACLP